MDLSTIAIFYEYGEGATAEQQEIIRNVRTILSTPIGTCPLYRDFGIKMTFLDHPLDIAQNLFAVEAIEAVERWEPRVIVKEVIFEPDINGKFKAKVVIGYG